MNLETAELPRQILVRSHWQDINLGDVAHTIGMLNVLERFVPSARVIIWPWTRFTDEIRAWVLRRFPSAVIVEGSIESALSNPDEPENAKLLNAFMTSDLFLHTSGPATLAWADMAMFKKLTGKPFGVCGVTYGLYGIPERQTLSEAAFVYFRDSRSLSKARADGVSPSAIGFAPDVAFAFDMTDDERATSYLRSVGLEEGRYLCCIPRLRATQFWLVPRKQTPFNPEKHQRNELMKAHDHAQLLNAIIEVVRSTNLKVLVCPEDETQIVVGKEMLIDPLPADVRGSVVWRDRFWMPDEALAVYKRSAGLFGNEMHSPILCIGNGVPAIVCHSADTSTKGFMWQDIGLGQWLFDLDVAADYERIVSAVLSMISDSDDARANALAAKAKVWSHYAEMGEMILKTLNITTVKPTN